MKPVFVTNMHKDTLSCFPFKLSQILTVWGETAPKSMFNVKHLFFPVNYISVPEKKKTWIKNFELFVYILLRFEMRILSIEVLRENDFELTKKRNRKYPAKTITDADYAKDIALLANTPNQAETLLHSLEQATAGIGLYVNAHKTEYMCYNQTGNISTLDATSLKLVDKFTYLGSSVSSTEKDIDTRLTKAWTAIDRLSIIWKSDLTDKMKRSFFQAAVVSILLYGYTTWTLTKLLKKKLDGNYTRMLRAILNKSWRQHPTRHQLYGHLPPITKTIQVRRTRHAGHYWRSYVLLWTPAYGQAKAGRPARTYSSWRPAKSDEWLGEVAREGQGYPC